MSRDQRFAPLEKQDVSDFWPHEEHDFTPWLQQQIEADSASRLEEALELDLADIEREKRVGKYSVDLYAELPEDGRTVVIENQLGNSDHDHLGKAIAYAAGLDADIIVWIAPFFNAEHRDALHWLNENSREDVDLFALRLEVWRIGDSEPAVRFNPVVEPSEFSVGGGTDLTETKQLQKAFWTEFRDRARKRDSVLSPRKPKARHWTNVAVGRTGIDIKFTANTQRNVAEVGLLIRNDADAYDELANERSEIEQAFSGFDQELVWKEPTETSAGKQRSQILCRRSFDLYEENSWEQTLEWMLDCGEQFHEVFAPRVQDL